MTTHWETASLCEPWEVKVGEQKEAKYYDDLWPGIEKAIGRYREKKEPCQWDALWNGAADRVASIAPKGVVDVGCGAAHFALALEETMGEDAPTYLGVDFSEVAIGIAEKAKFPEPKYTFGVADVVTGGLAQPMEVDDDYEAKDVAYVMIEFLEHIDDDLGVLMQVPPGAHVILTVPNFGDAAHVRWFDNLMDVIARYGCMLDNLMAEECSTGRHFMLTGTKKWGKGLVAGITTVVVAWDEEKGVSNLMCSVGGNVLYLVDSKTRDNTAEIAKGQGAKVVDFDWEDDFSYARNLAHQHVDTSWILVLDGHESVEGYDLLNEAILDHPDAAVFEVEVVMENGEAHMRDRLYHKDRCEWRNRAHNVLHVKEGRRVHVDHVRVVHDRYSYQALDSRTHRSTQRDAMLRKVLREEIDRNPLDTRSMFYLGQQHRDAARWVPCYYWYDRYTRTENGNQWPEEEFQAHYQAGLAALCLRDLGGAKRHAQAATELLGATRAEGWVLLGAVHYTKKEYAEALKAYEEASFVEVPTDAKLWVDRTLHAGGWMITDKICMCHWHLGNHEKAVGIYKALLSKGEFPGGEREHLEKNLEWHEGRLNRT